MITSASDYIHALPIITSSMLEVINKISDHILFMAGFLLDFAIGIARAFFMLDFANYKSYSNPLVPLESLTHSSAGSIPETVQEWLIDHGLYTDFILRKGIRLLLNKRVADLNRQYNVNDAESFATRKYDFAHSLRQLPDLAILTDKANQQHYEVDTQFFIQCLGKMMKYSCCLYPIGNESLDQAEIAMLEMYCARSEMKNGLSVLDLGCGWGSLSLFLAQKYPKSKITGVSNSKTQKQYIDLQAKKRNISNLTIVTADINTWNTTEKFDRILSIEMFEHLKNYDKIMSLISTILNHEGKLFLHMFVHKDKPYHFQTNESQSWMARHFFSGGTMPSLDLFPTFFQNKLAMDHVWVVNGKHYAKTSRHWLNNMDKHQSECMPWLMQCYGPEKGHMWWNRWRVFYIAVEELFAFNHGNEWFVAHYLFSHKK